MGVSQVPVRISKDDGNSAHVSVLSTQPQEGIILPVKKAGVGIKMDELRQALAGPEADHIIDGLKRLSLTLEVQSKVYGVDNRAYRTIAQFTYTNAARGENVIYG